MKHILLNSTLLYSKSKNGALITSEQEIANSFNDYFINICNDTKKSENKSDSYSTYLKNEPNSNLSFSEVTIHTVLSIIDSLKQKTSSPSKQSVPFSRHLLSFWLGICVCGQSGRHTTSFSFRLGDLVTF